MFIITFQILWSFSYFFFFLYLFFVISVLYYIFPITKNLASFNSLKKNLNFFYILGIEFYWINVTFLLMIFLIHFSWVSPLLSLWFGNLIFSSFQYKIGFLIFFFFLFSYCFVFYVFLFIVKRNFWLFINLL